MLRLHWPNFFFFFFSPLPIISSFSGCSHMDDSTFHLFLHFHQFVSFDLSLTRIVGRSYMHQNSSIEMKKNCSADRFPFVRFAEGKKLVLFITAAA
jgi:hypothetical protein